MPTIPRRLTLLEKKLASLPADKDEAPVFENTQQAEQLVKLVMEHYNATAHDLQAGRYAPVFEVHTRHDEVLWELWIEGFEAAMQLRSDSWAAILRGADAARVALSGLVMFIDLAQGESTLTTHEGQDLTEQAPDLIPAWVETLHT